MGDIKRIAFLMDFLFAGSFQQEMANGVIKALPEKGVDLYLFIGGGILRNNTDAYAVYLIRTRFLIGE